MHRHYLRASTVAAAAMATGVLVVSAQWPDYPTPGPRNDKGKIDVNAPPPRTSDGKIDFTGLWQQARAINLGQGKQGQGKQAKQATAPANPDEPPAGQFFNIGAGFKDGLPFTPWAKQLRAERTANNNKDNPDANCLPLGITQLHMHSQPRKIVQTPQVTIILYEANANVRQILNDGRSLPKGDNLTPWWYGYSIGHWEGKDTYVVETTGFRDDVWLDVEGSPLTSTGKITERWKRPTFGTMQIDVTIEDPKAYTKPFTIRVNHRLMADTELIEFVCEERDAVHYVGKAK